jgi:hypothetical protein
VEVRRKGCLISSSDATFALDLHLPDGAEFESFRLYDYDEIATNLNITSQMIAYDGAGNETVIAEVNSGSVFTGYDSVGIRLSHIVDNASEALVVQASIDSVQLHRLRLCGIRIAYLYNLFGTNLPAVLNQAQP